MKCFLDLDGVLADFVGAAVKAHGRPNPWNEGMDALGVDSFETIWGITTEEFYKPIKALGKDFWADLDKTREADYLVHVVEERFGSENCCILTAPKNGVVEIEGKYEWVRRNFPRYKNKIIVACNSKRYLASSEAVLIDDMEGHVEEFRFYGGEAILVPRPWNKDYAETFVLNTITRRLEILKCLV